MIIHFPYYPIESHANLVRRKAMMAAILVERSIFTT